MKMRTMLGSAVLVLGTILAATPVTPAGATDTTARDGRPAVEHRGDAVVERSFTTWATNVNVRHNNGDFARCNNSPSVANCPNVRGRVNPGESFEAWCQKRGSQTVGGNPYWVYIIRPNFSGWMASYYVDYADHVLPDTPFC